MRSLALLTTLGALTTCALADSSIHCYEDPGDGISNVSLAEALRSALIGPMDAFCRQKHLPGQYTVHEHKVENTNLRITFEDGQNVNCAAAFGKIIDQCIIQEEVCGGEVDVDGILYEIYDIRPDPPEHYHTNIVDRGTYDEGHNEEGYDAQDELENTLEAANHYVAQEKRAKKPKPKLAVPGSKVTKTKQTAKPTTVLSQTKRPPTSKTPQASITPKNSPSPHPSPRKSSSSPRSQPTHNCKEIVAKARKYPREQARDVRDSSSERGFYVGGLTQRASNARLEENNHSEGVWKRAAKPGISCKQEFNAFPYPGHGDASVNGPGARFYSFQRPQDCKRMEWSRGNQRLQAVQGYEIEHILEWQVVTKFFDWVSDTHHKAQQFLPDPEPGAQPSKKLTFCQYWTNLWDFEFPINSQTRTAKDHIKHAYPSSQDHVGEFVWLDRDLNAPAKEQQWRDKKTPGVLGDTTMKKLIKNIRTAEVAAMRLKWVMGARMYLKDPTIERYFSRQKWRIGEILHQIDTEMPNHQKTNDDGDTFQAWQPQGLRDLWDKYMDQKFATAKSRVDFTMNEYVKALEQRYAKGRPQAGTLQWNVQTTTKALATAWRKEGRSKWMAPWVKRPIGPGGTFTQPEEVFPDST